VVLFITLPYLYIKFVSCSVPIRKFVGLPDPDQLVRGADPDSDPDPPVIKQK